MSYIGKKPSFSQVRTAELVVQRGTDITTAGTVAALDVSNISLVRLTAATVLQGLVAPSAPANNGKRVTLVNANSVSLAVANESGSATAANRISTGISRDLVITAGASVTLFYNTASSRWSVESSSSEINIDRLQVATETIVLNSVDLAPTSSPKSGLIELSAGSQTSIRSISTGANGQFLAIINKTGSLLQIANEDAGATPADRVVTGTGGPISLQSNASLFLAYLGSASRWQVVGGTGSGGGATEQVTQTGIGSLAVGTPLYVDASTGWTAANASAANTAEVAGMLGRSLSANLAEVVMAGEVSGVAAAMFTEAVLPARGEVVFLSATSGKLTITEPSVVGQVSKPLGVVHNVNGSTSVDIMFFNWRGSVVGGANARTTISLANSATTSVQSVSAYDAGELAGWVFIDATTDRRFYIQAQFAKNGAGTDFNISYQTTGDTPPAGFSMTVTSAGMIQVTLPSVAGFSSATINYALNAPAVGATLPLSIDSTALNIVDSAPLSYRNRVINGDMRIDQRNSGAALSYTGSDSKYNLDRWTAGIFGTTYPGGTLLNIQQSTDAPAGFTNSLRVTAAQNIAFDSNKLGSFITHNIEGNNIADFAFGTASASVITLSFWVKSNKTGTVSVSIENGGGDRAYGATVSIAQAATWERKTITVTGDTLGTWLSNNGKGMAVTFGIGNNGSWLTGAAGSWSATRAVFNSAQTNFLSATNDYLALTGVQLEAGSKASAFERRPYSEELAKCMRYYYRHVTTANSYFGMGGVETPSTLNVIYYVPQDMRVSPSVQNVSNPNGVAVEFGSGTFPSGFTSVSIGLASSARIFRVQFNGGSGGIVGSVGMVRATGTNFLEIGFGAEL